MPAPGKNIRPNLETWISDDIGAGVDLTFAKKQAAKRIADLKSINEAASPMLEQIIEHPNKANRLTRNQEAGFWTKEDTARMKETEELRQRGIAVEEMRLLENERRMLVQEHRAKVQQDLLSGLEHLSKKPSAKPSPTKKKSALRSVIKTPSAEPSPTEKNSAKTPLDSVVNSVSRLSVLWPVSETVKYVMKSVETAHATAISASTSSKAKSQLPVEALISERAQVLKERAGDYSRYLPLELGREPRGVSPTAYARLALARRRETKLAERLAAIDIIAGLVLRNEVRAEV
jgi:hypothetical protein